MNLIMGNKRLVGEKFATYKKRLKYEKSLLKIYLKGVLVWDSTPCPTGELNKDGFPILKGRTFRRSHE